MSEYLRTDEFSEPVLTNTAAWWAKMDVPGMNVVRDDVCDIVPAFDEFLPWTVRKVNLYDPETFEPSDVFVNKRSDTGKVLSPGLSDIYTNIQPHDVRDLMAAGLADVDYCVSSLGGLLHGRVMFASVQVGDLIGEINVEGQKLQPYLAVVNTYDGSSALKVVNTVIRPECLNTIDAGFRSGQGIGQLRHTTNVMDRVDDLKNAIRSYLSVMDDFQREVARMIQTDVSARQAEAVFDAFAPIPEPKVKNGVVSNKAAITRAENYRQALDETYTFDNRVGFVGTEWGLFQTITTIGQNETTLRKTAGGPATVDERKMVKLFTGKTGTEDAAIATRIEKVLQTA